MGPKPKIAQSGQLFDYPLIEHLNQGHPLIQLAALMDWDAIDRVASERFPSKRGRPAVPPRLIASLLYLQHTYDLSNEEVVWSWVENPYWQVFSGETYLQKAPPIDPSSLTRWRKRLGEAGVEELLAQTIEATKRASVIKASRHQGIERQARDCGYDRDGESDDAPNRFQTAGTLPGTPGEDGTGMRPDAAAELQSGGAKTGQIFPR